MKGSHREEIMKNGDDGCFEVNDNNIADVYSQQIFKPNSILTITGNLQQLEFPGQFITGEIISGSFYLNVKLINNSIDFVDDLPERVFVGVVENKRMRRSV
ncbi:hypothetical protein BC936DRAFT_147712 [Jimgerdemannia flammicorona]|uniref:Uncharacterized protein n=1 Tax=Jimgerdemannia flammicorona TaxID=994334 RepID=A0A433DL08_9FUNG|nr:hypothetical protein BC936DRAFT_147712 [Jimgerdemannia flammicorona]